MAYKDFYQLMLECFTQPVELVTPAQNKPFTIYAENESLYVKNTVGNIRQIRSNNVAVFIERFEDIESFSPGAYQDVTVNASYLLAAMKYITEKYQ